MDDLMIASIEPEKGKGHQENHSRCSFELTMGGGGGGGESREICCGARLY